MAGETVVVSWSITNWITVVLMVLIAFVVVGAVVGLWNKARGNSDATA